MNKPKKDYGPDFKFKVVRDYLDTTHRGDKCAYSELARKYNVTNSQTVKGWIEKYTPVIEYPRLLEENAKLQEENTMLAMKFEVAKDFVATK